MALFSWKRPEFQYMLIVNSESNEIFVNETNCNFSQTKVDIFDYHRGIFCAENKFCLTSDNWVFLIEDLYYIFKYLIDVLSGRKFDPRT